jgi:hypothetical protein
LILFHNAFDGSSIFQTNKLHSDAFLFFLSFHSSTKTITLLASVWCRALKRTVSSTLSSMTRCRRNVLCSFFAWIGMTVGFWRWNRIWVSVLKLTHLHSSLVVCFCSFCAICVDASFGKIVCATSCDDEYTPAVAVDCVSIVVEMRVCFLLGSVPDRSDL